MMDQVTKENLNKIFLMVMEYLNIKMVKYIEENGKMIKCMDMENFIGLEE